MPTLAQRLSDAARQLEEVTETPRLDAEILLSHVLGISRAQLLSRLREESDAPGFDALLARRLAWEPIAYILGHWEFFSLDFLTRKPVLVPRPETEHLVEVALEHLNNHGGNRVLDLCTGTGCVAIAIAHNAPGATVVATDLQEYALSLAGENAAKHHVSIEFRKGDLYAALAPGTPPVDVIVSNPPYVSTLEWPDLSPVIRLHEDPAALLAGTDGLDALRRIIAEAPARLRPNGLLAVEIGEGQYEAVESLLRAAGLMRCGCKNDLAGIQRVAFGCIP